MKSLLNFDFPLPPLEEQERIVAKLDAISAEIERHRHATEQKIAHWHALKQATLTQALTPQKDWKMVKLGDVCKMYQPKTISKKEMKSDGEYLVYGANGVIGRYDKFNHEEPQLLVTSRGATCGAINIASTVFVDKWQCNGDTAQFERSVIALHRIFF